jgi:hypothetical protein
VAVIDAALRRELAIPAQRTDRPVTLTVLLLGSTVVVAAFRGDHLLHGVAGRGSTMS